MDGGRFVGSIKSINAEKGFGFIECPPAHDRWRKDVYLHKKFIGDLQVGDEISFVVEENDDGKPQARDILRLDGSDGAHQRRRSEDGKGGKGKGKSGGKGKGGKGKGGKG